MTQEYCGGKMMKHFLLTTVLCMSISTAVFSQEHRNEMAPFITGLSIPGGVLYDNNGVLYIAEWGNQRVCRYDGNGKRIVVTENVGDPSGIAFDRDNNLYVAHYSGGVVYKFDPEGRKSIYARGFSVPAGITFIDDILYVPNRDAGEVVRVEKDGTQTIVARGLPQPVAVLKRGGKLVISCLSGPVYTVDSSGKAHVLTPGITGSGINIVPDTDDAFYICVISSGTVERITMNGARTVLAEGFSTPLGIARRPDGNLIFAAWGQGAAYKLDLK
jgi:DNA-binding beta-propeller fold protein YncE